MHKFISEGLICFPHKFWHLSYEFVHYVLQLIHEGIFHLPQFFASNWKNNQLESSQSHKPGMPSSDGGSAPERTTSSLESSQDNIWLSVFCSGVWSLTTWITSYCESLCFMLYIQMSLSHNWKLILLWRNILLLS